MSFGKFLTVLGRGGVRYLWAIEEKGTCHSCAAPILWCRTHHGKLIPVNVPPANVFTSSSHFATCPEGASWRRARR